ncbi:lysosomal Pro-X carboxypeptidase-like [Senna tora]|uniref:Lysosomal Pro-X carboxypeptidase-like n=1 Tax=Senna tora TaxID=362788 RepID=A0A834TJL8_9FABA|nr:lysosomal Pro-X carboxypeptidase-like [Senna tora]
MSSSSSLPESLRTFYYTQRLDHFNYRPDSYTTFQQRYMMDFKYWGGPKANAPIFAYLGAEAPVDQDMNFVGFLRENAPQFNALIVYIEHRFYGKSIPFGSMKDAMENASTRGYFNSAQAIADYADVLLHIKQRFSAHNSPIIVIGGSYGGMLASWFRLKYPHIALGALASSAPILYFNGVAPQAGYYYIVTKDFKHSYEVKEYLDKVITEAAQYNEPPMYPVSTMCEAIDASNNSDTLGQIFEGVVAYKGKKPCYDMDEYNLPSQTNIGWSWQACSEMVMPIGHERNDSMFPAAPFNMKSFVDDCMSYYGVLPQPHWVTTYYGGHVC